MEEERDIGVETRRRFEDFFEVFSVLTNTRRRSLWQVALAPFPSLCWSFTFKRYTKYQKVCRLIRPKSVGYFLEWIRWLSYCCNSKKKWDTLPGRFPPSNSASVSSCSASPQWKPEVAWKFKLEYLTYWISAILHVSNIWCIYLKHIWRTFRIRLMYRNYNHNSLWPTCSNL